MSRSLSVRHHEERAGVGNFSVSVSRGRVSGSLFAQTGLGVSWGGAVEIRLRGLCMDESQHPQPSVSSCVCRVSPMRS